MNIDEIYNEHSLIELGISNQSALVLNLLSLLGSNDKIETFTNLEDQSMPIGSMWTIHHTNLFSPITNSSLTTTTTLYIRNEMIRLWEQLESLHGYNRMVLYGSPGIGKSMLLYGWMQYKRNKCHKLIYSTYSTEFGYHILVCGYHGHKAITRYSLPVTDNSTVHDKVSQLLQYLYDDIQPEYMIYNDFTRESDMFYFANGASFACSVIYCTSYDSTEDVTGKLYDIYMRLGYIEYEMKEWPFEEYLEAIHLGVVGGIVK